MKYVKANTLMYDATLGRVEPGETYYVEDDKAERWVVAGVAATASAPTRESPPAPPPPQPDPQPIPPEPQPPQPIPPEPEDEGDEEPEEASAELRAEVKRLFEAGHSQRAVAEQLGISRQRVHDLLRT
jgi:hypothetical protein